MLIAKVRCSLGDINLSDIPLEAYDYIVNGKSAIEWIIENFGSETPSFYDGFTVK